jgi:hypothetical protein
LEKTRIQPTPTCTLEPTGWPMFVVQAGFPGSLVPQVNMKALEAPFHSSKNEAFP